MPPFLLRAVAVALATVVSISTALAADAGKVKVSRGAVWIERAGRRVPAQVGMAVQESDVLITGADGALGIAFGDDSLLSMGPNSVVAIDRFAFDPTTHGGSFLTTLRRGTLSAVSGKLTRQSPDAMKVRTPSAILGVRGTELLVGTELTD
jgi:hypothetical protein